MTRECRHQTTQRKAETWQHWRRLQSYALADSRLSSNKNIHGSGSERQTDRQTDTDRKKDRQRDTDREIQTDRQNVQRQTDREERQRGGWGWDLDFCVLCYPPRKPNNRVVQAVS